jgi:DNA-binding Lrp family transcriptional regulator
MELWAYVVKYIEENGYQPSRAEMAERFRISETSVQSRLEGLEQRGRVVMTGIDRALQMPDIKFKAVKREKNPAE